MTLLRPVAPGGHCYQCTHLTLPPVWELLPLLPLFLSACFFPLSFINIIALPVLPDSLSLHVFHFLCVSVFRACTSLPGAVEGLLLLFSRRAREVLY